MNVALVKYNAGNTRSVLNALKRLGVEAIVSDDAEVLRSADKVIFPGVGEAATAMRYLKERNLDQLLPTLKQPFLGICLGMQLMCTHSEEGNTDCLSIFPLTVKRFGDEHKVPQMGWNTLTKMQGPLFDGMGTNPYMYFVHSYYVPLSEWSIAETAYGLGYSSAIRKDNFFAVQFHPEKSAEDGSLLIQNFLNI
jgi:glutamine amidotransferase